MKSNFCFYCFGTLMSLIAIVSSSKYDVAYIQEPCEYNRVISPGQGGFSRYGFIRADSDGCIDGYPQCSIYLNASAGYHITMRFQNLAIDCNSGFLEITGESGPSPYCNYHTPTYSIYSSSNWLRYNLIIHYVPYCQSGFSFYYTTFHTGECNSDEFRCAFDGRCIPAELKCDLYDNCGDWSDEKSGTCGLTTGAIAAISVTCCLVGLSCIAFLIYCIYDKKSRRHHNSTPRRGSTNRCAPDTVPAVPVGPPSYAESPPDYTYINTVYSGVYENDNPDESYKAPPTYQSISINNGYPN
jgi:hypothetical protein